MGGFTRKTHKKGGVAGFAKQGMERHIKLLKLSSEKSELICETALFEIKLKKETVLVLGIYRPPSSNLDQAIDIMTDQLNDALSSRKQIVIMGDINVNNLDVDDSENTKLEELLTSFNLTRLTLPPTRLTPQTQRSIDWICTNMERQHIETSVILSGLSDHTAQIARLKLSGERPAPLNEKRRIFNTNSINKFKIKLQKQNWESVYLEENANTSYEQFHKIIQTTLNETCPVRLVRKKLDKQNPCWDDECTRLRNLYTQALEKELCTGRPEAKIETRTRKKDYDLKLKSLRKEKTSDYINKADNKSKALWTVINKERRSKHETDQQWQLVTDNNITIKDPTEIANHLNNYFATIAEKTLENNGISLNTNDQGMFLPNVNATFHFEHATEEEIKKAIDTMKPKTSSGYDEISAKLVKFCKNELSKPLENIINKSLSQGIYPSLLKLSKVYPKHKKGPTTDSSSYRPISLIPTFSKVFEKIALHRLLSHLEQHQLLTSHQHGFRKGKSTTTALIQLTEHVIDQLDDGCLVTSFFLDFSKAFDCLSHSRLLKKLYILGIDGIEAQWFHSYLNDRHQIVELSYTDDNTLKKTLSKTAKIARGVPQGSVLGPVLFLLLTNDLPHLLGDHCKTIMYADDTVITLANKSAEALLFQASITLDKAKEYCDNNQLALNETKTVQLNFRTKKQNVNIPINRIDTLNESKYLGITMDSKLSWRQHTDQLCKKLSSGTYVMRRILHSSNLETAKTAYYALFESHLRYGIAVWGGSSNNNLQRVLIQQKRAVRCLANLGYQDSCKEAFKELKILTVISLYIREVITHAIFSQETRHQDFHQHNTRNAADFALPLHHLTLYEKKPTYKGALFYNHLPCHLKKEPVKTFKTALTKWLLDHPYYKEKEFLEDQHV